MGACFAVLALIWSVCAATDMVAATRRDGIRSTFFAAETDLAREIFRSPPPHDD